VKAQSQSFRFKRALCGVLGLLLVFAAGCAGSGGKRVDAAVPPEKRLADARKAVARHPNDPDALYRMGNALFDLQRYQDAATAYEGVLAIDPKHVAAHVNLGLSLKRLNRLPEAIAHYEAALALAPDDRVTLCDLAAAQESKGDLEEAAKTLSRLVELQPDDIQVLSRQANVLFKLGRYDEAAGVFEKVIKKDPGLSDDYYNLGLCHFHQANYDAALRTWLAALAHEPRNRSVNKGLAVLYWKRHEYRQAWEAVARCRSMGIPLDPEFLDNLRNDSGLSGPPSGK